jgi:hypothetical protein
VRATSGGARPAAAPVTAAQGGDKQAQVPSRVGGTRIASRFSPKRRAPRNKLNQSNNDGSPTVKTRHSSRGQTAATVELRRGHAGATQDSDANTWHRRLALVLANPLDSSSSTVWRRGDGGNTRLGLGRRGAKLGGVGHTPRVLMQGRKKTDSY